MYKLSTGYHWTTIWGNKGMIRILQQSHTGSTNMLGLLILGLTLIFIT